MSGYDKFDEPVDCDPLELRDLARRLDSALRRTERNLRLAVAGKPVRDMGENLAENRAALGEL